MLNIFITNGAIEQSVAISMWAKMLSGPLKLWQYQVSSNARAPQLCPHHTKGQQGTHWGPQGTCQGPVCLILDWNSGRKTC